MATDIVETIGEAIVDFLPAQTYTDMVVTEDSVQFDWSLLQDIKELHALKVDIVPGEDAVYTPITRHHLMETYPFNVIVRMLATESDRTRIRALRVLTDDVIGHLAFQAQGGVGWIGITGGAVVDQIAMQSRVLYSSTFVTTYQRQIDRRT